MLFLVICQVVGGTLIAISWIPQVLQAIKGKTAHQVDLKPLSFLFVGTVLVEVYSVFLALQGEAVTLFVTNTIQLIVVTILISIVFWAVPADKPAEVKERISRTS
ncbi:hypothetical protein SAMN04487866_12110 [Thermoactinomyces sp. DSM 45891]|uniref:hypothetical protein n=1 Tax=Thermoactinomyces sp. DSM 45891 TaxID=1761907 RepID=UPI00091E2A30|nr:hypothetical protein [Thermoactinomyces sp. DSM 45891]SFX73654.1 hypothetical protein SAMN04487866_12110 [Thermoactinomyces sp. DSM 45891]